MAKLIVWTLYLCPTWKSRVYQQNYQQKYRFVPMAMQIRLPSAAPEPFRKTAGQEEETYVLTTSTVVSGRPRHSFWYVPIVHASQTNMSSSFGQRPRRCWVKLRNHLPVHAQIKYLDDQIVAPMLHSSDSLSVQKCMGLSWQLVNIPTKNSLLFLSFM